MMQESSGTIDRMFASGEVRDMRKGRLQHNVDLGNYGHVEQTVPETLKGAMGVERVRAYAIVDGEHVDHEDSAVLPMEEVYRDGMTQGQPEIGRLEHAYAELPDGRLMLERVTSVLHQEDAVHRQEIVRAFDLATGSTKEERLTVDGRLHTTRMYADSADYDGGSMVTDTVYRPDGGYSKRVVHFRRPNEGWQVHEATFDRSGKETVKPWTHSLKGPEALTGPDQPVGFVRSARMAPDKKAL